MPVLAVPLRAPDPDVVWYLGALVVTVYPDGAYTYASTTIGIGLYPE